MLFHRLFVRRDPSRLKCLLKQTRYTSSQVAPQPELFGSGLDMRLSPHRPKKPTREPFAKNLFVGKFDTEILTYPETQSHERHREFFEWLQPIEEYIRERVDAQEIDRTGTIKEEIFDDLRKLGVFRAPVEEVYGGLGLNNSEYAKLVETLSAVPVLGSFMVKRAAVIQFIRKFGKEEQKADLLPKIARGELRPSFCFSETSTGSVADPLKSKAIPTLCQTAIDIRADKSLVFDASKANLFVVIAPLQTADNYVKKELLSAFIIPRDSPGIEISEPIRSLGQKGIDLNDVSFNVKIPSEGQLGSGVAEADIFVTAMGEGRCIGGAQAIGITKRFLNHLCDYLKETKNFNSQIQREDSMHNIIGRIATKLYAMEAVTYLTTGMIDNFENQDAAVEQSLVECYCNRLAREVILEALGLLGARAYNTNQPFELIVRDFLVLGNYGAPHIDTKIFAALMGLQQAGQVITDKVKTLRNPFFQPIELIKTALSIQRRKKYHLDQYLHPSLRVASKSLEISVNKMKECVETLCVRHGLHVVNERMELARLTDILIEIYAMTAVVARASRAYCIGLKNCDDEVQIAMYYTYQTYERVNSLVTELDDGNWSNGDIVLKNVATTIFQQKQYFAAHPLERTF
ncbi:complex I assembly factor ACAD9, mitochondrial [Venturia canescens]|uniref:complex I assembly factor ACAD9, mitochondrial n=1 Tax=Venturia canescens TaxID=32260 RepID=UPI001C9BF6BD|nr:complex I assembly factor ACAD9, mitochondrial [Venturia canescens]